MQFRLSCDQAVILALSGGGIVELAEPFPNIYLDLTGPRGLAWIGAGLWSGRTSPATRLPPRDAVKTFSQKNLLPGGGRAPLLAAGPSERLADRRCVVGWALTRRAGDL